MDRLRHMMHAEMARAFDGLGEGVEQERGRREVVVRVIGQWRTPAVVEKFEQWLEEVMERKRSSDLNERDLRIMGLESDMSGMQEELESWVKMETFVCEQGRCPNEIDARLSMMCEMCGALNKSGVEKLQQRMEGDRERRLETARRVVMRRQRRQLAMALGTFGARTSAARVRRGRMDRLRRMMHAEMTRAFDGLGEGVEQGRGRREVVVRVIG